MTTQVGVGKSDECECDRASENLVLHLSGFCLISSPLGPKKYERIVLKSHAHESFFLSKGLESVMVDLNKNRKCSKFE